MVFSIVTPEFVKRRKDIIRREDLYYCIRIIEGNTKKRSAACPVNNPILFKELQKILIEYEKELIQVYCQPNLFSEREVFPKVNNTRLSPITQKLKETKKCVTKLDIEYCDMGIFVVNFSS